MLTFLQPGAKPSDTSQACPLCGSGQPASERYPDYVVRRTTANEKTELEHFMIGTTKCVVHEARFGGFVVEAANLQARKE